ncbi:hypothetical protein NW837_09020, partial [Synechococcus sp. R6-10]|uniref:hypothetical protein n=1 Tax=Synechococcus sp. R6-10 TaxID=2291956 RepID=UPI0039C08E62
PHPQPLSQRERGVRKQYNRNLSVLFKMTINLLVLNLVGVKPRKHDFCIPQFVNRLYCHLPFLQTLKQTLKIVT